MDGRERGVRRHLPLLVSGALVLLMGGLGLFASRSAGQQAMDVHRADRLQLQLRLAGLVDNYATLMGAEVVDRLAVLPAWSPAAGDPATAPRLQELVDTTRGLDVGALLLGPTGTPLASWSDGDGLPVPDDPGWAPLRAAVRTATPGVLPLSGVMAAGSRKAVALAVPATLADGSRGLLIGLWDPAQGALQQYVRDLEHGSTGHGYVLDVTGRAVAGPADAALGEPLPLPLLAAALATGGDSGIVVTQDDGEELITTWARAGRSGWTALTPQSREEFEGALERSSERVALSVAGLIVAAGVGLVALHRRREAALEVVALRDELTGLYNRRGWFVLAEHELERARRHGTARALLFVDLDGLKQVNDALGHRQGDRAIADAAAVLRGASRSCDLIGRLGGDEFVLLLAEDGDAGVARQRLLDAVARHNARSSTDFELRFSVGAEVWRATQAYSLDELLRRADDAMYTDKASRPDRGAGLLRVPAQRAALAARSERT